MRSSKTVRQVRELLGVRAQQIKIIAKLLDDDGFQIGQVSGNPINNVIMPGMNGAFDIIITGHDLRSASNYNLEFDYRVAEPKNQVIQII